MKINTDVLDLVNVYENLKLAEILDLYDGVIEAKNGLEHCLAMLRDDSTDILERIQEIMDIEEQMAFIDANIKVLITAILCHESRVFERRTLSSGLAHVCLN